MPRSDLRDYSDACIVAKGTIAVTRPNNDVYDKKLAFKNNAPLNSCITKNKNTLIDNAEEFDIEIPMHNLIKYSKNYRKTTGSYYRDEPNSGSDGANNNRINYSIKDSKSFHYKTSITGKLEGGNVEKDAVKTAVSLKYLSNFWRTLDMPLTLTWFENCVLRSKAYRGAVASQGNSPPVVASQGNSPPVDGINNPTGVTFKIKDTKLHVPVVTLSAENDNKLLEQLKTGFKRTIAWKKYRSEMSNQTKNNNLNYLIDPTFTNVNRLFVLSFKNEHENDDGNESVRTSFKKYYVPKVEVKDLMY